MHSVKILYRKIHQGHHENAAGVTALGTSTGEAADVGCCFVAFHLLVFMYLYRQPTWNLPTVAVYTMIEEIVNITGHCGYKVCPLLVVLTSPDCARVCAAFRPC